MSTTKNLWGAALRLLVTLVAVASAPLSLADPPQDALDGIRVLALAPLAGKATLELPEAGMVLVKEGDEVAETRVVVVEVLSDRLVLEDRSGDEVSWVWLYKPKRPGEPSRLRRLSRRNPEPLTRSAAPEWIGVTDPEKDAPRGGRILEAGAEQAPSPTTKKEEGGNGHGR